MLKLLLRLGDGRSGLELPRNWEHWDSASANPLPAHPCIRDMSFLVKKNVAC